MQETGGVWWWGYLMQAKVSRMEVTAEGNAATRLLAQQGFNMERLARDLKSYELHTTFEEVFPVEGATVEEYLQQVRALK